MYNQGYIEIVKGECVGELSIDGVDISPITGYYFKYQGTSWLWVKRKRILEYSFETNEYKSKSPTPMFEVYMQKETKKQSTIAYKGTFIFFKFKYKIFGIWDTNEKNKKKQRLNLYVERLPMEEQNIINNIKSLK